MKTINYQNWQLTQYKPREDDESPMGATSNTDDRSNASQTLSRVRSGAIVGFGIYAANRAITTMTSNVKNITGSTKKQETVNRARDISTLIIGSIVTKGATFVFEGINRSTEYGMRRVNNSIENAVREEDNKLLGKRRNVGGHYD